MLSDESVPCTWPANPAFAFWGFDICPRPISLAVGSSLSSAVSGGWWSGKIGNAYSSGCSGSDPLVANGASGRINVNVWEAWKQGLWSSSVVISFYVYTSFNITVTAGAGLYKGFTDPSNPTPSISDAGATASKSLTAQTLRCPDFKYFDLTVYDDGSIGIAFT
jgi:hypothetical protein